MEAMGSLLAEAKTIVLPKQEEVAIAA